MGTDPTVKTWWFLEAHDGSWLADADHELFTRDPNEALKWPNRTRADAARRGLHQDLWARIAAATEHAWIAPSPRTLTPLEGELLEAARRVVARWDTPPWEDAEPTARVIAGLRVAIARATDAEASPPGRRAWLSPETGAELLHFKRLDPPPGPPVPGALVDPTNGQLWGFQMGVLRKFAGRATPEELEALSKAEQP